MTNRTGIGNGEPERKQPTSDDCSEVKSAGHRGADRQTRGKAAKDHEWGFDCPACGKDHF
jgi:hypothetical protein